MAVEVEVARADLGNDGGVDGDLDSAGSAELLRVVPVGSLFGAKAPGSDPDAPSATTSYVRQRAGERRSGEPPGRLSWRR